MPVTGFTPTGAAKSPRHERPLRWLSGKFRGANKRRSRSEGSSTTTTETEEGDDSGPSLPASPQRTESERKTVGLCMRQAQELVTVLGNVLENRDLLSATLTDCSACISLANRNMAKEVADLQQLYSELAEAFQNLKIVQNQRRCIRKDTAAMKSITQEIKRKECLELERLACTYESDVYHRWQNLKNSQSTSSLRGLLSDVQGKQRALDGVSRLITQRLSKLEASSSADLPLDQAASTHVTFLGSRPAPQSRRSNRPTNKRKHHDFDGSNDRKSSLQPRQLMLMRYNSRPPAPPLPPVLTPPRLTLPGNRDITFVPIPLPDAPKTTSRTEAEVDTEEEEDDGDTATDDTVDLTVVGESCIFGISPDPPEDEQEMNLSSPD